MERRCKSKKVDFFSNLPDTLFHKILSLLDIRDVARVSSLSRRCRQICLSSPFLTIHLGNVRSLKKFYKFVAFLHRFMSLRNGVNIHKFEVTICNDNSYDDVEFHMGNWLLEATRCNVGKICLDLESFSVFNLPSAVLNSACLRDLELYWDFDGIVKFPSASFGGLENLTMRNVVVSSEFCDWISSCKSLKMAYLHGVGLEDGMNISSSSLEDLTLGDDDFVHYSEIKVSAERLKNLRIIFPSYEELSHSLTLHAPKLERFSWAGCASNYSCEGNLEFLCHSDISIKCTSIANNEYESLDNGIIGKVLQSMHRVSSMSICDVSIKEISLPELLPEFCNLLSLTLIRTNALNEITSVVLLLKSIPQLNTLKILGIPYFKEKKISLRAEYWESQGLPFVHSLKEVEMEIEGKNNEIELIKYLLKNARALKKMIILYKAVLCRESAIRKIEEFQIASSCIALYFRPV